MRRLLFMSKGQARPGSIPGLPAEKNKTKGENNGRQTKQFRGKNFKKSVKWLSVWQWKRFR